MGKQNRIALDLIWLGKAMRQYVGRGCDTGLEPITGTQAFIIDYLYTAEKRGVDIFQRDIERQFGIGRSATSGMLQLMEKNGMIRRTSVPQDARLRVASTPPRREVRCARSPCWSARRYRPTAARGSSRAADIRPPRPPASHRAAPHRTARRP